MKEPSKLSLTTVTTVIDYYPANTRKAPVAASLLRRIASIIAVLAIQCGIGQAAELQLISVKENSPGVVTVTTGIFGGGTPSASDFRLRLGEKKSIGAKEVTPVPPESLQTAMIVAVDQSGSMGSATGQVQQALRNVLLSKSAAQLNLALWAFDAEVTKLHGFSQDPSELVKSVGKIGIRSYQDGKTKLYEAIELGLSELRHLESKGPKRLVLITDGKDDGSSITDEIVIKEANTKGVIIDAIGYGKVSDTGANVLASLTKKTGGHFVSAKGPQELSRELAKLFNLPPPRVFDVLFKYEASEGGELIKSARLEFAPAGQDPVLQVIDYALSSPKVGGSPAPSENAAQPGNGKQGVDLRIVFGVLGAFIAVFVAYALSRKKRAEPSPPTPPRPEPPEPPQPPPPPEPRKRAGTRISYTFPPPAKDRPSAFLDCIRGACKGRIFPVEQAVFRIGSRNENELQVSDDYVSQAHAAIRYDSGSLYLSDSGSRNGTFLNESRLQSSAMILTPGDEIRVGKTSFKVMAASGPTAPRRDQGGEWQEPQVP